MKKDQTLFAALCGPTAAATPDDGSVLPFPPTASASKAGPTSQESVHQRRVEPDRLPKDAPNILIVLIDDVGFSVPDTFGGTDLDSPVSLDYFDQPPFAFNSTIATTAIKYLRQ